MVDMTAMFLSGDPETEDLPFKNRSRVVRLAETLNGYST
jgi:hypothetical protein